jgi:uncharacterized metal-binding protein YceD (DUF177 family)
MTNPSALRVADLPQNTSSSFSLRPNAADLKSISAELSLLGLRKLSFEGKIKAQGKKDWVLVAKLGATVVQPCVVTLDPVSTRIDVPVRRVYMADWEEPEEDDVEMHEDDEVEALAEYIDPAAVMIESLSLALPQYPRVEGADSSETVFTEPGKRPMTQEDAKPFAGLAALRDSLKKEE